MRLVSFNKKVKKEGSFVSNGYHQKVLKLFRKKEICLFNYFSEIVRKLNNNDIKDF